MIKRWYSIAILSLFISCPLSYGQGREPISVGYLHQFEGEIDNGGEVAVDRWSANVGVPLSKGDDHVVVLTATYLTDHYDFSSLFDPWGRTRQLSIGLPIRWNINDKWTLSSVLRAGSALESGADSGESYAYGLVTSMSYRVNDKLLIGPGFSYFSQLEDDASLFPILSISWNFRDRWILATGPSEGANSGANIYMKYDMNEKWDFLTGLYYQNNRFRLSSRSIFAPDGVGEDSSMALYCVAKYSPKDDFSISLIAGYAFNKEYNVFDAEGVSLAEEGADGVPFVGLRMNYEF